jgi:ABC-2 type transport system ATP-binding protein
MCACSAVQVEGLTKSFGEVSALRGVSFTVAEGEVFGYLGPNGSGKTTTVRIISTLIRPTSGTARVFGLDVQADSLKVRGCIGLVQQARASNPISRCSRTYRSMRTFAECPGTKPGQLLRP